MAHLAILLPVPFLAAPAGLLIDGSKGGLPVVRGWTVSSAVHLSALKKLQKDHILLYIDSLYNRLFHAITNYDWKVLDYQKKRDIMSSLSRSLSPITTPSGFSCTRAWAVGHTSPESGWPVWRRAPTRPGCCPRNGAGECQILDILNESFPRGLNMKCHEIGSMFGFMIEWFLAYPTKYHEMDFQDIFESTQLSS